MSSAHLSGLHDSVVSLESRRPDFEGSAVEEQWKGKEKEGMEPGKGKEKKLFSHDRVGRSLFR